MATYVGYWMKENNGRSSTREDEKGTPQKHMERRYQKRDDIKKFTGKVHTGR